MNKVKKITLYLSREKSTGVIYGLWEKGGGAQDRQVEIDQEIWELYNKAERDYYRMQGLLETIYHDRDHSEQFG